MRIYRGDYGRPAYEYILNNDLSKKRKKPKLGCGSCGGFKGWGDIGDLMTTLFSTCPDGQLWDKGAGECTPVRVRDASGVRLWQGTSAPSLVPYAAKWWLTGGSPVDYKSPLQSVYDVFTDKGTSPGIDWMTIGLIALVGFLIIKKL